MKLRNKKTGEIKDIQSIMLIVSHGGDIDNFGSLDEFNEEWEDYEPKEPRINFEDARDAVYSWASSLQIHEVRCTKRANGFGIETTTFEAFRLGSAPRIEFTSSCLDADVADGGIYTIDELCGEKG